MTAVIEARALEKRYGTHLAIDGIDLRVDRGSVVGLVGPNGAGKTTMLRMLVDIIRPTAGELTVLGREPRRSSAAQRCRIGYLPGEWRLAERMRGRTLLHHLAQLSGPVEPGTVEGYAERLGLDLDRPARALSKGNRQKLGLIQAFMHRPELLILDEPTSGLDPLMQREFLTMVAEARDAGQTVLLSSHILSELQHVADEMVVLSAGRIVARGDVASLRLASVAQLRAILDGASAEAIRARLAWLPMLHDLSAEPTASGHVSLDATVRGEIDPVIKALAEFTIRDLSIEEPDLETSVLDLYSRTESGK